jgi:hypothetical protein
MESNTMADPCTEHYCYAVSSGNSLTYHYAKRAPFARAYLASITNSLPSPLHGDVRVRPGGPELRAGDAVRGDAAGCLGDGEADAVKKGTKP